MKRGRVKIVRGSLCGNKAYPPPPPFTPPRFFPPPSLWCRRTPRGAALARTTAGTAIAGRTDWGERARERDSARVREMGVCVKGRIERGGDDKVSTRAIHRRTIQE